MRNSAYKHIRMCAWMKESLTMTSEAYVCVSECSENYYLGFKWEVLSHLRRLSFKILTKKCKNLRDFSTSVVPFPSSLVRVWLFIDCASFWNVEMDHFESKMLKLHVYESKYNKTIRARFTSAGTKFLDNAIQKVSKFCWISSW